MSSQFQGVIPPVVTPRHADGSIDTASLQNLTKHLLDGGVSGLFVLGSSAEVPYMTNAERELVVSTIAEANAGAGPADRGRQRTDHQPRDRGSPQGHRPWRRRHRGHLHVLRHRQRGRDRNALPCHPRRRRQADLRLRRPGPHALQAPHRPAGPARPRRRDRRRQGLLRRRRLLPPAAPRRPRTSTTSTSSPATK